MRPIVFKRICFNTKHIQNAENIIAVSVNVRSGLKGRVERIFFFGIYYSLKVELTGILCSTVR